jgi:hypothetical protein
MSVIGGDITELTFNHPTLGTGVLFVKSDEDSELDLGGHRSADEDKGVDTGGNMIDVMTLSRWSATFVVAGDLTTREDLEKITNLAKDPVLAVWTITHISGTIYRAAGKPVGDVKQAMKAATIQLKISGGGVAKKVA